MLLIDDGIATGFTVQAAAKALRAQFITAIVIGVPVISAGAFELLNPEVDDLTALMIPEQFPLCQPVVWRFQPGQRRSGRCAAR